MLKSSFIISFLLSCAVLVHAADAPKPKYGPASAPKATPLVLEHKYLQNPKNLAPDFWSLIDYSWPQRDDFSCSAATLTSILNAAKAMDKGKTAADENVVQDALVEKIKAESWAERLSKPGFNGSHGTSLDVFAKITEAALKEYGFPKATVTVVHVDKKNPKIKARLLKDLAANEATNRDFIAVNFNQKAFTDDADVGHLAPIGAYDAARQKVLIMDPDRHYYQSYWVSVTTLLDGMSTQDSENKINRGYLYIKLN